MDSHFKTWMPGTGPGMTSLSAPIDRLRVDEHEGEIGRLVRSIAPGVVGAALNQHVAGLEQHLALVHQRMDLAGQYDRIVDRIGLVKTRMAGVAAIQRRAPSGAVVVARRALAGER